MINTILMIAAVALRVSDAVVVAPDAFLERPTPGSVARWGGGAATDLTNALSRIVGKPIPLYRESQAPAEAKAVIYLGDVAAARAAGMARRPFPNLGFYTKATEGRVFIWAKTATGVSYGVTDFLDRFCDYRQMTISGDDPFVPNPGLTVPECNVTDRPSIYSRSVYCSCGPEDSGPRTKFGLEGDRSVYPRRMRLHFRTEDMDGPDRVSQQMKGMHSLYDYLPPEKYFKEHPEYYSMGEDGQRHGVPNANSQICFTNPDVYRLVYEALEGFVRADREAYPDDPPTVYDITQMDSCDYLCLCPECRKVIAKYDRKGGHKDGGDAGLQLEFVNRLARQIREKYPDVKLRTFAYVSTEQVPKGIVPEPNVIIWLCDLYMHSNHMLPLSHPLNLPRQKIIDDWRAIALRLEIWDYMLYGTHYSRGRMFPEVNVDAIAEDARYFHEIGLKRYFMEVEYDGQVFYELNSYVLSRFLWRPDADLERCIDEYCEVYGAGATKMREAIDLVRQATRTQVPKDAGDFMNRIIPWRNVDFYEQLRQPVAAAYALAQKPVEKARIANVLSCIDNELAHMRGGTATERAKANADEANALAEKLEFVTFEIDDPTARTAAVERNRARIRRQKELDELAFTDMPTGLKAGADGVFCIDWRRFHGQKTVSVADDAVSETGKTILIEPGKYTDPKFECGTYDYTSKESAYFFVDLPEEDFSYRWVKAGTGHIARQPVFWFGGWWGLIDLGHAFISCDGAPKDLNWFDVWVSVSRQDGRLRLDRLVLSRTDPPKKGN